ncbi:MAG: hypothetical protein A2V93_05470 [Ignavibacteria bacterium RBG_16_34_14]|nr:MAG: hypothetical protein A2V93_05470 [Ignavibacteria bacterium RBG_16_34_14]
MNYRKYFRNIIPVLLGAIGGFFYYNFIGCYSGSCAITSNPLMSTTYGALVGLAFTNFTTNKKKVEKNEN